MSILYSKTAHTAGGSGFFFDSDKNAPADAFPVSNADHSTAINLNTMQPGATYDFTAPVAPAKVGTLIVTTLTAAQMAAIQTAKKLAEYQQSARSAVLASQGTFDRIQEAITLGKVPATDAVVQAWYNWRIAVRGEIKAAAVPTDAAGAALTILQKHPKPTSYPAGT